MRPVPHQVFSAFIRGDSREETAAEIKRVREENPAYQLFLELVEQLRQESSIDWQYHGAESPLSHAQTEKLMASVLDGSINEREKADFLRQLVNSPAYYQRCLSKLEQVQERLYIDRDKQQVAELQLRPMSTRALLNIVEREGNTRIAISRPSPQFAKESFWEKLKSVIFTDFPVFKPVIAATPVLALLVVAGLWVSSNMVVDGGIFKHNVPYQLTASTSFDWQQPLPSGRRTGGGQGSIVELTQSLKIVLLKARQDYEAYRYDKVIDDLETIKPHYAQPLMNSVAEIPGQSSDSLITIYRESRKLLQEFYFFLGVNHLAKSRQDGFFPKNPERQLDAAAGNLLMARQLAAKYTIETGGREGEWLEAVERYRNRDRAKKWF